MEVLDLKEAVQSLQPELREGRRALVRSRWGIQEGEPVKLEERSWLP